MKVSLYKQKFPLGGLIWKLSLR